MLSQHPLGLPPIPSEGGVAQGPGEKQPQALGVAQGKGRDMSLSRSCGVFLEVGSREVCAFNQEGQGGDLHMEMGKAAQ